MLLLVLGSLLNEVFELVVHAFDSSFLKIAVLHCNCERKLSNMFVVYNILFLV